MGVVMMYTRLTDKALDELALKLLGVEEVDGYELFPEDYDFFEIDKFWEALDELNAFVKDKRTQAAVTLAIFGKTLTSSPEDNIFGVMCEDLPEAISGLEKLDVPALVEKANQRRWWRRSELRWDYRDPELVEELSFAKKQLLDFYKQAAQNGENVVLFAG
ncbi:MAG: DUF1877 family protein [Actinomycetaceae bacterium]|nr:DUF1877 family protein [Actinomycetaceae bacterium]